MYNEASLSALMKKVGFTGVSAESYRTGRLPDLESIDNRPKNSIYVEGCKGEVWLSFANSFISHAQPKPIISFAEAGSALICVMLSFE